MVPFTTGYLLIKFTTVFYMMLAGRILTGVGVGLVSLTEEEKRPATGVQTRKRVSGSEGPRWENPRERQGSEEACLTLNESCLQVTTLSREGKKRDREALAASLLSSALGLFFSSLHQGLSLRARLHFRNCTHTPARWPGRH